MSELEQKLKAFAEKQIQAFSVDLDENVNLAIGYYPADGYIIADMIDIKKKTFFAVKIRTCNMGKTIHSCKISNFYRND